MLTLKNRSHLPAAVGSAPQVDMPFLNYVPNWQRMEELAKKFSFINRIILVANGGSINTFRGIYYAFKNKHTTPEVIFVDTNEPTFLNNILLSSDPSKTLLLSISKSGENISQLEATLYFYEFPHKIFITGKKGALYDIARRDSTIQLITHADIGGRFAGLTEVGLMPALLCGFDAHALTSSQSEAIDKAYALASYVHHMEQNKFTQILVSTYAHYLDGFGLFEQQLFHETFGKNGKGVTVVPVSSPESQHHTNQRLFGGQKNLAVVFVKFKPSSMYLSVSSDLFPVNFKERTLKDFEGLDLASAFEAEYLGTQSRAEELGIPNVTLELDELSPKSVGEYIRVWQVASVYGAVLRGVNPYDQPDVEASKVSSYRERFRPRKD